MTTKFIVTRGNKDGSVDPVFAGTAHSVAPNQFCVIKFKNDRVVDRQTFPPAQQADVTKHLFAAVRNGAKVFVDNRSGKNMIPQFQGTGDTFEAWNMLEVIRPKSDAEFRACAELDKKVHSFLLQNQDEKAFRGACEDGRDITKTMFKKTAFRGFTEYRGGMQCPKTGLKSELTKHIEDERFRGKPNPDFDRVRRLYRGLAHARANAQIGDSAEKIGAMVMSKMDPQTDQVFGPCFRSSGWETDEFAACQVSIPANDTIKLYDRLNFAAATSAVGSKEKPTIVSVGFKHFDREFRAAARPAPRPFRAAPAVPKPVIPKPVPRPVPEPTPDSYQGAVEKRSAPQNDFDTKDFLFG